MVAAVVALLAGGGVATGARSLVTGEEIKDRSITGKDIRAGTLGPRVFAKGMPGIQGVSGPSGPQGQPGPSGAAGPPGQGQTVDTQYNIIQPNAQTVIQTVGSGAVQSVSAICPPGYAVLSGGYRSSGAHGAKVFFNDSFGSGDRWAVGIENSGSSSATIAVTAYCVPSGQPDQPPDPGGGGTEEAIANAVAARRAGR
jgi:hypothetical protein